MVPARLNFVTFATRDVGQLRGFYEELGWSSSSPPSDRLVVFALGGAGLELMSHAAFAEEADVWEAGFPRFTCAINVETADMVDAVIERAAAAGATILKAPVQRGWGGRTGYFQDPDTNVWEVAWVPGSRFDTRGAFISPRRTPPGDHSSG